MGNTMGVRSNYGLEHHGLRNLSMEYWTLSTPALVERSISRGEAILAQDGALVARTGHHTGRSPNDKFIVQPLEGDDIWWGKVNRPMARENFERLHMRITAYLQGRDVFVQDTAVAVNSSYGVPIRVVTEDAWHSLFARNIFIQIPHDRLPGHVPEFTILHAPHCHAVSGEDGTNSESFIVLDFSQRLILIGGTKYAGEIKKSVFTVLNYLLPKKGVLSMHCSANMSPDGDVALFFGLSGTGKTTLSSDPARPLIGDDEHGWGDDGVFNFEGGCYAKVIHLRQDLEPLIWEAARRFGTILENVTLDPLTRQVDFADDSLTENTRAAYPISYLPNHAPAGRGGHPRHMFFLTADAFGVMPPLARLTPEQAMYYFLSGYTSKLAGTEKGLGSEPQATFSACFGAPFLPLDPGLYARMLGEKIARHRAQVWLLNTGWTGGPYGVGERIKLPYTRAMVRAVLNGRMDDVPMRHEPYFGLVIPKRCPDVPETLLDPSSTWEDKALYRQQARALMARFEENFARFAGTLPARIAEAGPRVQ